MPLSAGFSCRKQQSRELNLDSDEKTWTGTPDISQICGPLASLFCLCSFGNGSLWASLKGSTLGKIYITSVF